MSKVGKQPIEIPENIEVEIQDESVLISKDGEETEVDRLNGVEIEKDDGKLFFSVLDKDNKQFRSNWGTLRSLISNAIEGLKDGFEKTLILKGVGYRMKDQGDFLELSLGFSSPIKYEKPDDLNFEVEDKGKLTISGKNKQLVGQAAAEIRSFRPVEPYKGKGFRYEGEDVRRKVGKKGVGEGMGSEGGV
ncbi:MAG: 50S ribosomal protein L6 [Candidatus Magasanikbacteria bacterium]